MQFRICNSLQSNVRVIIVSVWLAFVGGYSPNVSAEDCEIPRFDRARDDDHYLAIVTACSATDDPSPEASTLLGYLYRNGFGVPRNSKAAAKQYESTLASDPCNPNAYCGLQTLAGSKTDPGCQVDCDALGRDAVDVEIGSADIVSARDLAYRLLSDMQKSGSGPVKLVADDLENALTEILDQEDALREEAYRKLCTGYIKRAVVTVSLAFQLEQETRRRAKLVAYHEEKVRTDNNARSQAALQTLSIAQHRANADRQVFFEKYTSATFSAGNCEAETLEDSYVAFEREIAEVKVTDLETQAFSLFRQHVQAARAGEGISSEWFGNLKDLLTDR